MIEEFCLQPCNFSKFQSRGWVMSWEKEDDEDDQHPVYQVLLSNEQIVEIVGWCGRQPCYSDRSATLLIDKESRQLVGVK